MAICRWSDYRCDLYIYEGHDGIWCHVAHRRYVDEPEPPATPAEWDDETWRAWQAAFLDYRERLAGAVLERIGLAHDGENRVFGEWGELREYVVGLRELGYGVPDWVVEEIEGEAKAEEGGYDDVSR